MQTGSPFSIQSLVPNPARDEIEIRIAGADPNASWQYELLDVLGRTVLKAVQASPVARVDVSGVTQGMYYIQIHGSGGTFGREIEILR